MLLHNTALLHANIYVCQRVTAVYAGLVYACTPLHRHPWLYTCDWVEPLEVQDKYVWQSVYLEAFSGGHLPAAARQQHDKP